MVEHIPSQFEQIVSTGSVVVVLILFVYVVIRFFKVMSY